MDRATVLHDLDCSVCRWSVAALLAWDRRQPLRPVAIQDAEARELLAGVSSGPESLIQAERGAARPGPTSGTRPTPSPGC